MAIREFVVYAEGKLPLRVVQDGRTWRKNTINHDSSLRVKVGNEGEVPLPRHVLERLRIEPGQAVELRAEAGTLVISKVEG